MIIGKDGYKVKCFKGALAHSSRTFAQVAEDMRTIMDALKKDGININGDPYWRLAYDAGRCEEMARICKTELEQ